MNTKPKIKPLIRLICLCRFGFRLYGLELLTDNQGDTLLLSDQALC